MTDELGFSPALAELRGFVYATLASEGRAPSLRECARVLGRSAEEVAADLRRLHDRHALVLTRDGDAVRMAHPFSAAPMGFVVSEGDRRWWGGCTWDSLGIAAAVGRKVSVETLCPACGVRLDFDAGPSVAPEPDLAVRIPLPAARWWDDVVWTCTRIRSYCSPDHVREHTAQAGEAVGEIVPLETMWRLANVWYGDRLSPTYRQRQREDSQALLESVGLTGEFWRLP